MAPASHLSSNKNTTRMRKACRDYSPRVWTKSAVLIFKNIRDTVHPAGGCGLHQEHANCLGKSLTQVQNSSPSNEFTEHRQTSSGTGSFVGFALSYMSSARRGRSMLRAGGPVGGVSAWGKKGGTAVHNGRARAFRWLHPMCLLSDAHPPANRCTHKHRGG